MNFAAMLYGGFVRLKMQIFSAKVHLTVRNAADNLDDL